MAEARKRGTSRETSSATTNFGVNYNNDVEACTTTIGAEPLSTPYSGMMMEQSTNDAADTTLKADLVSDRVDTVASAGGGGGRLVGEDSHIRSIAKGLTWRFIATGTTVVIAWFITGETNTAFRIGVIEFFAKFIIYYLHERIWAKIRI